MCSSDLTIGRQQRRCTAAPRGGIGWRGSHGPVECLNCRQATIEPQPRVKLKQRGMSRRQRKGARYCIRRLGRLAHIARDESGHMPGRCMAQRLRQQGVHDARGWKQAARGTLGQRGAQAGLNVGGGSCGC